MTIKLLLARTGARRLIRHLKVFGRKEGGRWQLIIVSVYVHCKTHRKRSDIEMNETLNLHRQRTKWTVDIELDKNDRDTS